LARTPSGPTSVAEYAFTRQQSADFRWRRVCGSHAGTGCPVEPRFDRHALALRSTTRRHLRDSPGTLATMGSLLSRFACSGRHSERKPRFASPSPFISIRYSPSRHSRTIAALPFRVSPQVASHRYCTYSIFIHAPRARVTIKLGYNDRFHRRISGSPPEGTGINFAEIDDTLERRFGKRSSRIGAGRRRFSNHRASRLPHPYGRSNLEHLASQPHPNFHLVPIQKPSADHPPTVSRGFPGGLSRFRLGHESNPTIRTSLRRSNFLFLQNL